MRSSEDGPASPKAPKFKRCKISRPQLIVLMQHFEDDPLPSFEKRQALATRLGMTPRSVQIWFQNRRQRLLKPMRQGESSSEAELSPRSGESGNEFDFSTAHGIEGAYDEGGKEAGASASASGEPPYASAAAAHLANMFAPLLRAASSGGMAGGGMAGGGLLRLAAAV